MTELTLVDKRNAPGAVVVNRSLHAQHRQILIKIARQTMIARGFVTDYSAQVLAEVNLLQGLNIRSNWQIRELTELQWCSIDHADTRDFDQLTHAETLPGGAVKIRVAVADVASVVKRASAVDEHARHNTTSVYTAARVFSMLPGKLSTDLTSLNKGARRHAMVIDLTLDANGALLESDIYPAVVQNQATLTYSSVAEWLENRTVVPPEIEAVGGLAEGLSLQADMALKLKAYRHERAALALETIVERPEFEGDALIALKAERKNRAREIIEEFMIAANDAVAKYLTSRNFPSLRRIVRTPRHWERIVELAQERGKELPQDPDPRALQQFLETMSSTDTAGFPELSLSIIKLLGSGEYILELPGNPAPGHFGLAVTDYTHSTAPNRRYPDLITQRLLKAALAGDSVPYSNEELTVLAERCTFYENAAKKVERQVLKSAGAMLLESRIGEHFDAMVTGASAKGSWVRLSNPPVEGRLVSGYSGLDVGRRIHVQLIHVNIARGYIDFDHAV